LSYPINSKLGLPDQYQEWRTEQYQAFSAMCKSEKEVFMLDAPTGVGKSVLGVGLHRQSKLNLGEDFKSVYLCGTKQLQDQIMRDFGDIAVTLKGRNNYPCAQKFDLFPDVTCDDCSFTSPHDCGYYADCEYHKQKLLAKEADLVVLNNAYFLNEANGFRPSFSGRNMIIADEIDAIDNALMSFIEFRLTTKQIDNYGLKLPYETENKDAWMAWMPATIESMNEYISSLKLSLPHGDWSIADIQINRRIKSMEKMVDKFNLILMEGNSGWIFYPNKTDKGTEYIFKPINVNKYANWYLWRHAEFNVGMSGTIWDAETVCRELGVEECDYMSLDSPFPIANRPIYFQPVCSLTKRTMHEELPLLLQAIHEDLPKYNNRKVLIHTTSYEIQRYLRANLDWEYQNLIMDHTSETREQALAQFQASKDPNIMLSPSFDRGVDLREKDNVGLQIICKVPFLNLGDPQVYAKLHSPNGERWYMLKAAQTMGQMTGRSVRSPTQKCDTRIYDSQFQRILDKLGRIIPQYWTGAIQKIPKKMNYKKFGAMI
jgi:Rad3-related DNA helicase